MAEKDKDDKTEQPTGRRLKSAREEGQVPTSAEVTGVSVLFAAGAVMLSAVGPTSNAFAVATRGLLARLHEALDVGGGVSQAFAVVEAGSWLVVPVAVAGFATAIVAGLAQTKGMFALKRFVPNFRKFNPFPKLKTLLFSKDAVVGLLQAAGKVVVIVAFTYDYYSGEMAALTLLGRQDVGEILTRLVSAAAGLGLRVAVLLLLFAVIDYIVQARRMKRELMMTKEEVKDESKQHEASPEVRKKQRGLAAQLAKGRMMSDVPKADVVLVNPTHFAVALRYDPSMQAPKVVAKGAEQLAARIRDLARTSGVPVVHNPPLTRAIYAETDVGQEVSAKLYQAVAEVLAFVYRVRRVPSAAGRQVR